MADKRPYIRLTDAQWADLAIRHDEGSTQTDLAEEFGISLRSIQNNLDRARHLAGRVTKTSRAESARATVDAIAAAARSAVAQSPTERKQRTREAAWEQSCIMEAILASSLADLAAEDAKVRITKLEVAATVSRRIYDIRHAALAMSARTDVDVLPELPIREMTAEEVQEIRAAQAAEDGLMADELAAWAAEQAEEELSSESEIVEEGVD